MIDIKDKLICDLKVDDIATAHVQLKYITSKGVVSK